VLPIAVDVDVQRIVLTVDVEVQKHLRNSFAIAHLGVQIDAIPEFGNSKSDMPPLLGNMRDGQGDLGLLSEPREVELLLMVVRSKRLGMTDGEAKDIDDQFCWKSAEGADVVVRRHSGGRKITQT
jgi:hypothetical protein